VYRCVMCVHPCMFTGADHCALQHALNALNCFRFFPLFCSFCKSGNKCFYTLMKQWYHLRQGKDLIHYMHFCLHVIHIHFKRCIFVHTYAQTKILFILDTHKTHALLQSHPSYNWAVRTQAVVEPSTWSCSALTGHIHMYTATQPHMHTHKNKNKNKQTNKQTHQSQFVGSEGRSKQSSSLPPGLSFGKYKCVIGLAVNHTTNGYPSVLQNETKTLLQTLNNASKQRKSVTQRDMQPFSRSSLLSFKQIWTNARCKQEYIILRECKAI